MVVLLDTNIIIDHLRQPSGKSILSLLVQNPSYELQISVISMQELYTGSSTLHIQKEKDLVTTTSQFHIVSYTYEIAKLAGTIERDLKKPIGFADAAIAATAITNGAALATLNERDFAGIESLTLMHGSFPSTS